MKPFAKMVPTLLLASFIFSQCDLIFVVAGVKSQTQKNGGVCQNKKCCCDHSGPDGQEAKCEMCYSPSNSPTQPSSSNETCCLYAADCNPAKSVPVPTADKNFGNVTGNSEILRFVQASYFEPVESAALKTDFQNPVFHPPPA